MPRAKFARLEPEKAQFNGLDQASQKKIGTSIKEREDKDYVTVRTDQKTKKLTKTRENN